MDVEASRSIRQAEVGASRTTVERTQGALRYPSRSGSRPIRPMVQAQTSIGSSTTRTSSRTSQSSTSRSAKMAPSVGKTSPSTKSATSISARRTKILTTTGKLVNDGETLLYRTKARDCRCCPLKAQCCPKGVRPQNPRSIYEEARDVAPGRWPRPRRSSNQAATGNDVEMLFAHLKRILRLGRLRLRGPCGAQFEFTLAAIAQNVRRLAKLVARPPPFAPLCVA